MDIRIEDPKRYRLSAIIVGNLIPFAFIVADLVVIALAILVFLAFGGNSIVGLLVLLFLLVWILGGTFAYFYLYPFLESLYLRRILGHLVGKNDRKVTQVWEVSFRPRIRGGLRGLLDDCDDIGVLHLEDDALRFDGDSVDLSIPYSEMVNIDLRSPGARRMWVLGGKIEVTVNDGGEERTLTIAERCAKTIPESRRTTADTFQILKYRFGGQRPPEQ